MKLAVQKINLAGQVLYKSPDRPKNRHFLLLNILVYILEKEAFERSIV